MVLTQSTMLSPESATLRYKNSPTLAVYLHSYGQTPRRRILNPHLGLLKCLLSTKLPVTPTTLYVPALFAVHISQAYLSYQIAKTDRAIGNIRVNLRTRMYHFDKIPVIADGSERAKSYNRTAKGLVIQSHEDAGAIDWLTSEQEKQTLVGEAVRRLYA